MKGSKSFYVTSPIFYPNAVLHMGHAYTVTLCDIFARFHRLAGEEVYFLTGADENTSKVVKAAAEAGKDPREFLDTITDAFKDLFSRLGISHDQFIRTSDEKVHWPGAVALWKLISDAGDIYKASYTGLYCVGCEAFYTEKDLVEGKCPLHLTVPESIKEENYFFRLSKYTEALKEKIRSGEFIITPVSRKNEILALLDRGLEDVSFSRPSGAMKWGIPVPGDPSQTMYVWCDALANYLSALGFGRGGENVKKFWPANVHVIGKDILRFHAAIWPAMLLSAQLPLPKALFVHGFITSGGKKMSKSLGNVVDPQKLISEYGAEALRYYLAREISPFEDGDLTEQSFKDAYNGSLANGLGNLVSRIMKLSATHLKPTAPEEVPVPAEVASALESFDTKRAMDFIWQKISALDQYMQAEKPFSVIKEDAAKGAELIRVAVGKLHEIASHLEPFMPETSQKIIALIKENKMPAQPLFVRK